MKTSGHITLLLLPILVQKVICIENAKKGIKQTEAQDRTFFPPYKFPFWGLPFGIFSGGGFFNPGLFPFVPGGPGFPPNDGIFGGPFGPGVFPGPNINPFAPPGSRPPPPAGGGPGGPMAGPGGPMGGGSYGNYGNYGGYGHQSYGSYSYKKPKKSYKKPEPEKPEETTPEPPKSNPCDSNSTTYEPSSPCSQEKEKTLEKPEETVEGMAEASGFPMLTDEQMINLMKIMKQNPISGQNPETSSNVYQNYEQTSPQAPPQMYEIPTTSSPNYAPNPEPNYPSNPSPIYSTPSPSPSPSPNQPLYLYYKMPETTESPTYYKIPPQNSYTTTTIATEMPKYYETPASPYKSPEMPVPTESPTYLENIVQQSMNYYSSNTAPPTPVITYANMPVEQNYYTQQQTTTPMPVQQQPYHYYRILESSTTPYKIPESSEKPSEYQQPTYYVEQSTPETEVKFSYMLSTPVDNSEKGSTYASSGSSNIELSPEIHKQMANVMTQIMYNNLNLPQQQQSQPTVIEQSKIEPYRQETNQNQNQIKRQIGQNQNGNPSVGLNDNGVRKGPFKRRRYNWKDVKNIISNPRTV